MIAIGDSSHSHVQQLLQHRDCDAALLCVTPETVSMAGFPVDRCQLTLLFPGLSHADFLRNLANRCSGRVIEVPADRGLSSSEVVASLVSVLAGRDR